MKSDAAMPSSSGPRSGHLESSVTRSAVLNFVPTLHQKPIFCFLLRHGDDLRPAALFVGIKDVGGHFPSLAELLPGNDVFARYRHGITLGVV